MSISAISQSLASRYQFKTLLGEGGTGEVYTAWDKHLRRTVAIKQVKVGNLNGNDVRSTWQEAMCLATLKHSNIVTIYDLGIEGDVPYIVMEYIQGETLERMVESAPLETSVFIDIARQCLEGLCSAHHAGLIHRDIKPANIMLSRLPTGSYQVKILDFGIASFAQNVSLEGLKPEDRVSDSIHWIAPEQIEGSPPPTSTVRSYGFARQTQEHPRDSAYPKGKTIERWGRREIDYPKVGPKGELSGSERVNSVAQGQIS